MIKTYLFDFDGTLVDSMQVFVKSIIQLLDDNGIDYPDDIVKTITPLGMMGTIDYLIKLGLDLPKEQIIDYMQKTMLEEYFYNIPAKKNVINGLKQLKQKGANLNILTASPHITLDACLKRLGIYDLFTNVWSCDDFNTTKANPELYKTVAEKIGEKAEDILFIDDNYNACKTAKQAGMTVCGIYDESSAEYERDIKNVTDYYIHYFKELLDI